MKRRLLSIVFTTLFSGSVLAGVVFEIEVTDHTGSDPVSEQTTAVSDGTNFKMEIPAERNGQAGDMIYRGDRREMVIVDHDDKSYMVMDEETMQRLGGQINQAMKQMEEAMKNVPPAQREMMERMMKERMPQMMSQSVPKFEVRKTDESNSVNGYDALRYDMLRDGRKVREMWVADWDEIEGGEEAAKAFEDMASFFQDMMDSLSSMSSMPGMADAMGDNPFSRMKEIGGFPVLTRELSDGGSLESESVLRSATRRDVDPAEFEPPAGYKRRSMGPN